MSTFVKYVIIFFVSMVPLYELRYTMVTLVPVMDVNYFLALFIGCIGNMIPVPIIFFFARKVLEWGKDKRTIGKFFTWCLNKGEKAGNKLKSKAGRGLYWALFLFVGIPVPGTGAWTGTLAASILNLDFKKTVVANLLGIILAGLIMMVVAIVAKGVLV